MSRLRGAIYLTSSSLIFVLSGYLTNVVLAHFLSPSTYGTYGAYISFLTAINVAQLFGFPQAVSKFAAEQEGRADDVLATGLKLQILLTVILSLILFLSAPLLAAVFKDARLVQYTKVVATLFPFYGLFALYSGYYNGIHKFRKQAAMNIAYSIAKIGLVLGLAAVMGLGGAIAGFALSPVVALLFGYKMPRSIQPFPISPMLVFALPLVLYAFFATLQLSIDLFSLKALGASTSDAGYYTAAQNIALIPYFGLSAIGQVLFPGVSRILAEGNLDKAKGLVKTALRYSLLIILPLTFLMIATAPALVQLLFGRAYLGAVSPLRILLLAYASLSVFSIMANILNGAGSTWQALRVVAVSVILSFIICVALVPKFGTNGAAIGSLLGAVLAGAWSSWLVGGKLQLSIEKASILKISLASALISVMALPFSSNAVLLPITFAVFGVSYLLALKALRELTIDDLVRVRAIFRHSSSVEGR